MAISTCFWWKPGWKTSQSRPPKHASRAAHGRFGRGNHAAGLNFGDCVAYALAKERDLSLLFKNDDFALTDLRPAL
jgi:ribonuclease VapC